MAPLPPPLVLMTDERRLPDPTPAILCLPPGAAVVFRHYDWPEREALGRRLRALCRTRRLWFLVAGDARLAVALRADGLHLPEWLARRGRPLGHRGLLSVACHSRAALARARTVGADWALLSPVFPTASHPGAKGLGPWRFRMLAQRAGLPVLPLGGVTRMRLRELPGAPGFAFSGA